MANSIPMLLILCTTFLLLILHSKVAMTTATTTTTTTAVSKDQTFCQMCTECEKRSYGGLENVSCVGFDGTPNDKKENQRNNNRSGGAQQKHDKDFFNNHNKASETKDVADTRKPITRSTEGPAYYSLTKDVIGWKPEQLDSADGALKRARKLFEESAERGVPEHPQSKVLRELRGESF